MDIRIPTQRNAFTEQAGAPFLVRLSVFDFPTKVSPIFDQRKNRCEIRLSYPRCPSEPEMTMVTVGDAQMEIDTRTGNVSRLIFPGKRPDDLAGKAWVVDMKLVQGKPTGTLPGQAVVGLRLEQGWKAARQIEIAVSSVQEELEVRPTQEVFEAVSVG